MSSFLMARTMKFTINEVRYRVTLFRDGTTDWAAEAAQGKWRKLRKDEIPESARRIVASSSD